MSARNLFAKTLLISGTACLVVTAGIWALPRIIQEQLELPPLAGFESTPDRSTDSAPKLRDSVGVSNSPMLNTVMEPMAVALPVAKAEPLRQPNQGEPLYRLLIPRIKVNNIVVYGSSDSALKSAPGHIEGTPFPWRGGNSAIAAHRDYFFWRLGELEIGDEVRVESEQGILVYKITDTRVVHESNVGVLSPTGQDQITLITCWPLIFLDNTPDHLVITTVSVGPRQGAISSQYQAK